MQAGDLTQVADIAAQVHPSYPEDAGIFSERLTLHPAGCHVLGDDAGVLAGYIISHPWLYGRPPALNTRLVELPAMPDTLYIHDIALLPTVRGGGFANGMARSVIFDAQAGGFRSVSLVAVNDSAPFWAKHGFRTIADSAHAEKLRSYDANACFMARML